MKAKLTRQQRRILEDQGGGPVNLVDPESQRCYVLLPQEEYERLLTFLPQDALPSAVGTGVSPGMLASQKAYWRDLPELLKMKSAKRQWMAYHGQQRIGFASTDAELYQECKGRGIPRGEFYVDRLEPRHLPPWAVEDLDIFFETEPPPAPSASA